MFDVIKNYDYDKILSMVLVVTFIGFIALNIFAVKEFKWYVDEYKKPLPWTFQIYTNPFSTNIEE